MFSAPRIGRTCLCRLVKRRSLTAAISPHRTISTNDAVSPALLARARLLAHEHASLTDKLAAGYEAAAAKRQGEIRSTASAWREYEDARSALCELDSLRQSTDHELRLLAEEDVAPTEARITRASQALCASLVPVHPFAHLPCLVEIRPGAGGDEAALFAGDLFRMYESFCGNHGLRTSQLKLETQDTCTTGSSASGNLHVQEAVLEVEAPGAYGLLRCEAGVHRVQRVPATESKGRTHTSAVSVLVLPALSSSSSGQDSVNDENDPNSDHYIDPSEVRTDIMRAQGAGGQHVNKTESAVRLTHMPTQTVVAIQDSRSQQRNRERAWQLLRSRLAQRRREEREAEQAQNRRSAGAGKVGRGDKVRTYNWSQGRVSDHRSGLDVRNLDDVLEGGDALTRLMESVRAWMAEQELQILLADEEARTK